MQALDLVRTSKKQNLVGTSVFIIAERKKMELGRELKENIVCFLN